jgi:hypothetical protein
VYKIALTNINRMAWHKCCKDACRMLNGQGIKQAYPDSFLSQQKK